MKLAVFTIDSASSTSKSTAVTQRVSSAASNSPKVDIIRCELQNFTNVAKSYVALGNALRAAVDESESDAHGLLSSRTEGAMNQDGLQGMSSDQTSWLHQCTQLLSIATRIAEKLHIEGQSCLVQCNDGRYVMPCFDLL